MRKKILFIFLFTSGMLFSQGNYQYTINSLNKQLQLAKADTVKVDVYNNISKQYALSGNREQAVFYAKKALYLSKQAGWDMGLVLSNKSLADSYKSTSLDSTRFYLLRALQISTLKGFERYEARLNSSIGATYSYIDNDKALQYFNRAIKVFGYINDNEGIVTVSDAAGNLCDHRGDFYNASDYYRKIIVIGERMNNADYIARGCANLATSYIVQEKYGKAREYYKRALQIYKKDKTKKAELWLVTNAVAESYFKEGLYDKGVEHYKTAYQYSLENADTFQQAISLLGLSNCYQKKNDTQQLDLYLNKTIAVTGSIPEIDRKIVLFEGIGSVKYDNGNFDDAMHFYKEALELAETVNKTLSLASGNLNVGRTYLSLARKSAEKDSGLLDNARDYLLKALEFSKQQGYIDGLRVAYRDLSEVYELLDDAKNGLAAYKEHIVYRDSVFGLKKQEEFAGKEFEYEYGRKEATLKAKQQIALNREQNIKNISFAGGGVFLLLSFGAGFAYVRKRKDNRAIMREKKRSEGLLLNILPFEVAEELKEKGEAEARCYSNVSILFTDFEGFTKLSEKMEPREIIAELNYCFKAFDDIITKHNIEKIKTIGDAYMAVCGLPAARPGHVRVILRAAFEMRDFMLAYKKRRIEEGKLYFEMRIGINTGEVIAGIVGTKKFAYDIWGDAVNIAARMESCGAVGKINISEATYNLIKDDFDTECRGGIETKGKGCVKMYFVEPKK